MENVNARVLQSNTLPPAVTTAVPTCFISTYVPEPFILPQDAAVHISSCNQTNPSPRTSTIKPHTPGEAAQRDPYYSLYIPPHAPPLPIQPHVESASLHGLTHTISLLSYRYCRASKRAAVSRQTNMPSVDTFFYLNEEDSDQLRWSYHLHCIATIEINSFYLSKSTLKPSYSGGTFQLQVGVYKKTDVDTHRRTIPNVRWIYWQPYRKTHIQTYRYIGNTTENQTNNRTRRSHTRTDGWTDQPQTNSYLHITDTHTPTHKRKYTYLHKHQHTNLHGRTPSAKLTIK